MSKTIYLVKLGFNVPIYLTDFHRDIVYGAKNYNAGKLKLNNGVVQKAEPSANDFSITFSAIDQTLVSAFGNNPYKNRPCVVTRATLDDDEQITDVETWLDGDMEKYTYTNKPKESTLKLTVSSIFGAFDTVTGVNLGSVFSDYINSDVTVHWGQVVSGSAAVGNGVGGPIGTDEPQMEQH